MEYRKVGRGGAGNYYSQQDIKEAAKQAAEKKDLEAQKSAVQSQPNSDDVASRKYQTSGRGGAGNVTDASTLTATTEESVDVTPGLQENGASGVGHYGRGGAGNYKTTASEPSEPVEREMQEMKRPVAPNDEEAGLQEPAKAHLGTEKLTYH